MTERLQPAPRAVRDRPVARRAILDAAAAHFAGEGFSGARIAAVATDARVSLKTLYKEFPSKEDLFEAVIADRFEQHVVPVLGAPSTATGAGEQVLELVELVLQAMEADRGFFRLYVRGSESVPERLRSQGRDPYARYVGAFEARLATLLASTGATVAPQDLAAALAATTLSLARSAVIADPPRPITSVAGSVRAIFGPMLRTAPSADIERPRH